MNVDFYLLELFSEKDAKPVTPDILLKQYKIWSKEKKELMSPEYKAGDGLLAYMKVMTTKENNGQAQEQTQKLLTIFGDGPENILEILKYLHQYAIQHKKTASPIYDACLFQLPNDQKKWHEKLPIWRQLAKKFHYEKWFMDLFPLARDIEKIRNSINKSKKRNSS